MLEAEINPTGEVLVEGHHVGELQGFRFTADQKAEGEDAKAVRAAAQKALATEFENRAERFSASANGDFALTADGLVRWIGAPVAILAAGEDALRPRAILLADEQLTGPARDKVAARIERFVNFQIETQLKPLFDLQSADQLSGMARGIAFQLVENFGLLNRRDVAEDVRGLDQEARAALRRLGVRFGAFHVFVPALLKPAPAGIVTLLWALKNDGKEKPGFGDVVHALASGRTSVVVDQAIDREFYRLAGYRNLGRRAVRVDILERLADLIRPALAWKAGTGVRPEGAFDGNAFLVTPAMMSILGATAEDMEEILKGLGYRGEVKPEAEIKSKLEALDAAAQPKADVPAAPVEAAAESAESEAATPTETVAETASPEPAAESASSEPTVASPSEPLAETTPSEPTGETASSEAVTATASSPDEAPTAEAAPSSPLAGEVSVKPTEGGGDDAPTSVAAAEPETPKTITVWRQGRFEGRPRRENGNRSERNAGGPRGRGAAATPAEGEAMPAAKREFRSKPREDRPAQERQGRDDRRGQGKGAPQRNRDDRPRGGKPGGKPDAKPAGERRWEAQPPREAKPARIDPDSPFAKLAALKEQMKK